MDESRGKKAGVNMFTIWGLIMDSGLLGNQYLNEWAIALSIGSL
jgi:hypothetical protein